MDHEDSSFSFSKNGRKKKIINYEEHFSEDSEVDDIYSDRDSLSSEAEVVSKESSKPKAKKTLEKKVRTKTKKVNFENALNLGSEGFSSEPDISSEIASDIYKKQDFSNLSLKKDHENRPLWISPNSGKILFEAFSPLASQAQDFLMAVAEPVSRPKLIHEYKLTPYSLYAAISVGLDPENIIKVLNKLSKTQLPESLSDFIRRCTKSYAKIKMVLKQNRYFIESYQDELLRKLLQDPEIANSRVLNSTELKKNSLAALNSELAPSIKNFDFLRSNKSPTQNISYSEAQLPLIDDLAAILEAMEDDLDDLEENVFSFEITNSSVEKVKKRCNELGYPVLEEYDFRQDQVNPSVKIDLKAKTVIRPYQEKCLNKMFGNGRARSGIIVLPCGAGKTLVGITAACTIKKSTLILCTSAVSVAQWRQQIILWTNAKPSQIATFTSGNKEFYAENIDIVISTYSMVGNIKHRSHTSKKMMDFLQSREWGLLLLDEVHVVPANMFRQVVTKVAAHAKLGLTATLVREDDKIIDLNFLIGPKLYEANWMDLAKQGHIANVECAEVWCPMTKEFYGEYLRETSRRRALLYVMNPAKLQACQFLIKLHESRGDKVIVFSDNVYALKSYALKLQKPFIYGATSHQERLRILQQFQYNPLLNTIFLSKVGDTSIDLPEANCLIQISAHYGSRRQEAQRLGRILRAKRQNKGVSSTNAYFYTLVSRDTTEMYYSVKRQQFLVDQGYVFKIITSLEGIDKIDDLVYPSKESQLELLQSVLMASEKDTELDSEDEEDLIENTLNPDPVQASIELAPRRTMGSMKSLSGADSMAYIEYNRPVANQFRGKEWEKKRGKKSRNF